jgi:hypothetical protein
MFHVLVFVTINIINGCPAVVVFISLNTNRRRKKVKLIECFYIRYNFCIDSSEVLAW